MLPYCQAAAARRTEFVAGASLVGELPLPDVRAPLQVQLGPQEPVLFIPLAPPVLPSLITDELRSSLIPATCVGVDSQNMCSASRDQIADTSVLTRLTAACVMLF